MQPYLFPYIGYFQLMHAAERFVVYDDVTFIKQGWINRNRILINGHPAFFVVPVKHASSFVSIRETMIDNGSQPHRGVDKLLKTFANAYRRAPEFDAVFPVVEEVLNRRVTSVVEIALASMKAVGEYLNISTEWVDSSEKYPSDLQGEDRVLAICKLEGATEYINASGGRELYSTERFQREGISLRFLKPRVIEYRQFNGPFVPWLSIIDVLMFNPRDIVRSYLDQYDLT